MERNATEYLAQYIEKNRLSAENISMNTGIPVEKIIPGTKEILEGQELLDLCSYLYIDPKSIP